MNDLRMKRSQEEEERQQLIEEKKEENRRRIEQAYGKSAVGAAGKSSPKRLQIYLFSAKDLDDGDIFGMVESSPTYRRDKATLAAIRERAKADEEGVEAESVSPAAVSNVTTSESSSAE
jgi:cell division protein FtsZ